LDLLTPLVQAWGGIALLWQPPATPPTARGKLLLRIAAATIGLLAIAGGVFFSTLTFSETDPWAQWVTGCLTFGLFGLPTSVIAIAMGVLVAFAHASKDTAYLAMAIVLAVTYFAQWLALSAALLRRSMF
jgi:hypothetical protein